MNIHYNNDIQRNATFLFGNERMLAFSSQDQRSSSVKKNETPNAQIEGGVRLTVHNY